MNARETLDALLALVAPRIPTDEDFIEACEYPDDEPDEMGVGIMWKRADAAEARRLIEGLRCHNPGRSGLIET